MLIFPAIDLYEGKAVRLLRGDYTQMTVYSDKPWEIASDFAAQGAVWLHTVDLEGAKSGQTPNLPVIERLVRDSGLRVEVGGGIRSMEVIDRYLDAGISRVILGTAAVRDPDFLAAAAARCPDQLAVGVDIRDGEVAVSGWTEKSGLDAFDFCAHLQTLGIQTLICTDISRDGAMQGANHALYQKLSNEFSMNIIASGGVSSLEDIRILRAMNLYGAIIGKAYYTGAISLKQAIEVAK